MAPWVGATLQVLLWVSLWLLAPGLPERQLVVILLDGMRWDYMELLPPEELGGFRHFKESGVRVEFVETVFPSVSLPAWTTLQTGLFPESHNVLGNRMYDRATGLEFNGSTSQLPMWWQNAEPFWVTATLQGLRAATLEWNRADVPFHGLLPEVAKGYTHSKQDFDGRVGEVIARLKDGFHLVMMYYGEIDSMGHDFGPASAPVMAELRRVGCGLQRLLEFARREAQGRRVHVMVVSDHGMAPACAVPFANLSHFVDVRRTTEKVICDMGSVAVFARPGQTRELLRRLGAVPGFATRLRADIPDEFHYKGGGRAPDLLMLSSPSARGRGVGGGAGAGAGAGRCTGGGGAHGLDPLRTPSMRAFFGAWGAAFAGEGLVHPPLRLVDLYQLYARVLGVRPRPHNGSWARVRRLLRPRPRTAVPPRARAASRGLLLLLALSALFLPLPLVASAPAPPAAFLAPARPARPAREEASALSAGGEGGGGGGEDVAQLRQEASDGAGGGVGGGGEGGSGPGEEQQHPATNLGSLEREDPALDSCECSSRPQHALHQRPHAHAAGADVAEQGFRGAQHAFKDTKTIQHTLNLKTAQLLQKMQGADEASLRRQQNGADTDKKVNFQIRLQNVPDSFTSQDGVDELKLLSKAKSTKKPEGKRRDDKTTKGFADTQDQESRSSLGTKSDASIFDNQRVIGGSSKKVEEGKKSADVTPELLEPSVESSRRFDNKNKAGSEKAEITEETPISKMAAKSETPDVGQQGVLDSSSKMEGPSKKGRTDVQVIPISIAIQIPDCDPNDASESCSAKYKPCQKSPETDNISGTDAKDPSIDSKNVNPNKVPNGKNCRTLTICAPGEIKCVPTKVGSRIANSTKLRANLSRMPSESLYKQRTRIMDINGISTVSATESTLTRTVSQKVGETIDLKYIQDAKYGTNLEPQITPKNENCGHIQKNEIKTVNAAKHRKGDTNVEVLNTVISQALENRVKPGTGIHCVCDTERLDESKTPKHTKPSHSMGELDDERAQKLKGSLKTKSSKLSEELVTDKRQGWKDRTSTIVHDLKSKIIKDNINGKEKAINPLSASKNWNEVQYKKMELNDNTKATTKSDAGMLSVPRTNTFYDQSKLRSSIDKESSSKNEKNGITEESVSNSQKEGELQETTFKSPESPTEKLKSFDDTYRARNDKIAQKEVPPLKDDENIGKLEMKERLEYGGEIDKTVQNEKESGDQHEDDEGKRCEKCGAREFAPFANHIKVANSNENINKYVSTDVSGKKQHLQNIYDQKVTSKIDNTMNKMFTESSTVELKDGNSENPTSLESSSTDLQFQSPATTFHSNLDQETATSLPEENSDYVQFFPETTENGQVKSSTIQYEDTNEINSDSGSHLNKKESLEPSQVSTREKGNLKYIKTTEKRNTDRPNGLNDDNSLLAPNFKHSSLGASNLQSSAKHILGSEGLIGKRWNAETENRKWNIAKYVSRLRRFARENGLMRPVQLNINGGKEDGTKTQSSVEEANIARRDALTTESKKPYLNKLHMMEGDTMRLRLDIQKEDLAQSNVGEAPLQKPSSKRRPTEHATAQQFIAPRATTPRRRPRADECVGEQPQEEEGDEEYTAQRREFTRAWDEHFAKVRAERASSAVDGGAEEVARDGGRRSHASSQLLGDHKCW